MAIDPYTGDIVSDEDLDKLKQLEASEPKRYTVADYIVYTGLKSPVRGINTDKGLVYHASDVCRLLGFKSAYQALKIHATESDYVRHSIIDSMGGVSLFLTPVGVVKLLLKSKTSDAKAFKDWLIDRAFISNDTTAIPKNVKGWVGLINFEID